MGDSKPALIGGKERKLKNSRVPKDSNGISEPLHVICLIIGIASDV